MERASRSGDGIGHFGLAHFADGGEDFERTGIGCFEGYVHRALDAAAADQPAKWLAAVSAELNELGWSGELGGCEGADFSGNCGHEFTCRGRRANGLSEV